MTFPRTHASFLLLGSCIAAGIAAPAARAEDYVTRTYVTRDDVTGTLTPSASRCADFGGDFIDMGNGICARVGSTSRVQLGTHSVSAGAWTSGATSNAALRSTDTMMSATSVEHVRVRNRLESSPFQ